LEDRFGDPSTHDWVLAGDLNDYTELMRLLISQMLVTGLVYIAVFAPDEGQSPSNLIDITKLP